MDAVRYLHGIVYNDKTLRLKTDRLTNPTYRHVEIYSSDFIFIYLIGPKKPTTPCNATGAVGDV